MKKLMHYLRWVSACLQFAGCASARGRLSTVLIGGRLSRDHAQLGMLMPTSLPHDLFCF